MAAAPQVTPELTRVPDHVGIIMDGNGRWATSRRLLRPQGHQEGLKAAKRVVTAAAEMGLRYLSLYTFSTENWRRTADEVRFLMGLVAENLRKEHDFFRENDIRVVHSGDVARLPDDVVAELDRVQSETGKHKGLAVNLAINYGGRDEIIRAFSRILEAHKNNGDALDFISEDRYRQFLDLPDFPDPDLIIRTGGEMRMSNFLLWESAYSELYFSDKLWPDWRAADLRSALLEFQRRSRRFGAAQ